MTHKTLDDDKIKIRKLTQAHDGEWFHVPRRGHALVCCDCSLAHLIVPRIRHGKIEIKATRLRGLTATQRRARKITVKYT